MREPPTLTTERLELRSFVMSDAPALCVLAGEKEIAAATIRIPYPYPESAAEAWIAARASAVARDEEINFAVVLGPAGELAGDLVGGVGLVLSLGDRRADLGYWIAQPHWGRAYATEAATAALDYGFGPLGLNRIHAHHMVGNAASGRVLEKIGMKYEGEFPQHVLKWDRFVDIRLYGMLKSQYDERRAAGARTE